MQTLRETSPCSGTLSISDVLYYECQYDRQHAVPDTNSGLP